MEKYRNFNERGGEEERKKIEQIGNDVQYIYKMGGMLPPPPRYKHINIKEYAKEYGCKTLIETGSFYGDTIDAVKDIFEEIYTIELSQELFLSVQKRFQNISKIHCYQGDSAILLPNILKKCNENPIFWLDAHYSGGITEKTNKESPIVEELEIILNKFKKVVILIDDARIFETSDNYPSIFTVKQIVKSKFPKAEFEVYSDIIRIVIGHIKK